MKPEQPTASKALHTRRVPWWCVLGAFVCAAAWSAEREICVGLSGQRLIRCIEAEARGKPVPPTPETQAGRSVELPRAPQSPPAVPRTIEPPPPPPEDCTSKSDEALRRCLAAGGRLQPSAAVVSDQPRAASPTYTQPAACDSKTGEDLRRCIEASAKAPQERTAVAAAVKHDTVFCTGYHAADQPLCVHRNEAILECRNARKYPDVDVCLRSQMSRAPTPAHADCSKLQARSRTHCEHRNQAFVHCAGDKLAYFACLERRLGTDAILQRR